jgi:hypothetical protein
LQPGGKGTRNRVVVPLGDDEHEVRVAIEPEAGFRGGGYEVEVDAHRAHHHDTVGRRRGNVTFTQTATRPRQRCSVDAIEPDPARLAANRPPQPPLGNELIERMARRARSPLVLHDAEHPAKRGLGREVPVDHRGQLPVRFADADVEPPVRDTSHFEPAQLTGDVTVLDHDVEPRVHEESHQSWFVRRRLRRRHHLCFGRMQVSAPQPPHRRRIDEQRRSAGEQPGVALDEEMQLVDVVSSGPGKGVAERSGGVVVDIDPRRGSGDARRTPGEGLGDALLDAEVPGDERAEPDVEKG